MGVSGRYFGVFDVNVGYISTDVFNSTVTCNVFAKKIFQHQAYNFGHPTCNMYGIEHPYPQPPAISCGNQGTAYLLFIFFWLANAAMQNNVSTVNALHMPLLTFSRRFRLVAIPPPHTTNRSYLTFFLNKVKVLTTHQPILRKYKNQ